MQWLVNELGGGSDGEEMVKVSKDGKVTETPDDRTGNELNFNERRGREQKYKLSDEMVTEDEVQEKKDLKNLPPIYIFNE